MTFSCRAGVCLVSLCLAVALTRFLCFTLCPALISLRFLFSAAFRLFYARLFFVSFPFSFPVFSPFVSCFLFLSSAVFSCFPCFLGNMPSQPVDHLHSQSITVCLLLSSQGNLPAPVFLPVHALKQPTHSSNQTLETLSLYPPPPLSPDRNSHVELTDHSSTEVFFCVSFFGVGGWITSLVCEPGLRAEIEVVVLQLKTARCRSGARGPTAATSVATASSSASERCVSTPRTAASTVPPSSSAGPASASMRTSAPSSTWSTKPRNCKVSLCRIAALLSSTGSAL